jgi:hypothetical protein
MEMIYAIATLGSVLASVLAWAAKLQWSKEFAKAKDETLKAKEEEIRTKEAQIQFLEREIVSVKSAKQEMLETMDRQIATLRISYDRELNVKEAELQGLRSLMSTEVREHFIATKNQLERIIQERDEELKQLRSAGNVPATVVQKLEDKKEEIEGIDQRLFDSAANIANLALQYSPVVGQKLLDFVKYIPDYETAKALGRPIRRTQRSSDVRIVDEE